MAEHSSTHLHCRKVAIKRAADRDSAAAIPARYQQTIQGAFREVSDALVAYRKTQEFRQQQELLVASAQDASRLSHLRYSGGVGYLEVLTNETNYFSAELGLAQAQLNELLALAEVYKALGGGRKQ